MKTQNRLLDGLRQRLIGLLEESTEIFVYLRKDLSIVDKAEEEVFGREHYLSKKTEQELLAMQKQNEVEIQKVTEVIENEFVMEDAKRVFTQDTLMELPEKQEKKPKNWLTQKILEEQESEERSLMQAIDR